MSQHHKTSTTEVPLPRACDRKVYWWTLLPDQEIHLKVCAIIFLTETGHMQCQVIFKH